MKQNLVNEIYIMQNFIKIEICLNKINEHVHYTFLILINKTQIEISSFTIFYGF